MGINAYVCCEFPVELIVRNHNERQCLPDIATKRRGAYYHARNTTLPLHAYQPSPTNLDHAKELYNTALLAYGAL